MEDARRLIEDLFEPSASIFWSDLLLSSFIGWSGFVFACLAKPLSWQTFVAIIVSVFGLYRASAFIHELSHLKSKPLSGFTFAWNLIIGVPLLFPDFVYGIHSEHHRLSTYGTVDDPQYLPSVVSRKALVGAVVQSVLIPALLLLRFLVLSALGLLYPPFHQFLEERASSVGANKAYRRRVSAVEQTHIIAIELLILGIWSAFIVLAWQGVLPWRVFAIWYAVGAGIGFISTIESIREHRFYPRNSSLSLVGQMLDSTNISTPWAVLWAPVGFRFHALHHLFPGIPYHNLPIAHHRLTDGLPADSPYHAANSPSLWHSLQALWVSLN